MAGLLLLLLPAVLMAQHQLVIRGKDMDSVAIRKLGLTNEFISQEECTRYIQGIPGLLARKGYAAASVDTVYTLENQTMIDLYVGQRYEWGKLRIHGLDDRMLQQAGLSVPVRSSSSFTIGSVEQLQQRLLDFLANRGYPFAVVTLDSVELDGNKLSGVLVIEKGLPYLIDSFHVEGNVKINDNFLHRYLDLPHGSPFQRDKLDAIRTRLRELPYLEEAKPWDLKFGGNGAVVNLYLQQKKASQVNVLVGFLPSNDQLQGNKMLVTGEANLNLRNTLGNGETIGVNWQQIQVQSPRLNLLYQQPYLFGSAFGVNAQFDLFKKDSSFLNLNLLLGAQYAVSARKTGKVFFQQLSTNLITVDTAAIKASKQLPQDIDVTILNLGVDYEQVTTDYRRNPRRGWELQGSVVAGTRKIRENNAILEIKDPSFDPRSLYDSIDLSTYQFRIRAILARFLKLGRQSTIKLGANGGWIQSPDLFRNELFQIGGYKLLRGFDEESIFASRYLVTTLEYRYLVGMNSYFFGFADAGWTTNKSSMGNYNNRFFGTGIGLAFETNAGFFNLSLGVGKRDDAPMNFRQAKIHLGYVNYF
ncbi:BamA/TamA family outer membrane protein [Flavihumibacter rivuli]|uniref:ShlB/FhaC/HecB family hemolysin secretion/activation protein n=1 Tax=Flavihumibacter rivuli TaxID=2838156 RepID=UPI001BDE0006|nr:ShlB/FhaC/HecB family hemolysin secretion/activation protein [Flavihumibacter rivuli]ULQ56309.1 BamA/TamA family outer membrane protein [Flavihumibacter rivuli]